MAQGRGPWKIFVLKAYMAKFVFYGRSEVFLEYPGLFGVMRFCQLQGLNGILSLERGKYYCKRSFHCLIVKRQTVLRHVESQMTMGQTSVVLDE